MNQQLLSSTSKTSHFARAVTASLGFDIQLVVVDESRDYRDHVLELAGKVFQVYAYDANRVTHCCEITPSLTFRRSPIEYPRNFPCDPIGQGLRGASASIRRSVSSSHACISFFACR